MPMSKSPRRPAPSSARPSASKPRLRNQLLFVFGILVLAAGAFYTALVVATQVDQIFFPDGNIRAPGPLSRLPGVDKGEEAGGIGGGRVNVLVMGLDRRPREGSAPARTDTMFVMTIDPASKTARGLAMPRDLWVDIPTARGGSFKQRINTAYVFGETGDYPGGGPKLAMDTVEDLLDIDIHHYIVIDFEGFKELIDLIGGIDVDVETAVNDPYYSETELLYDYYPCVFSPGTHHMNGSDALCFARTRFNGSDFDRIQRQQRVILAAIEKATNLNLLADWSNMVSLWKRYKDTIETDISDLQAPGFAKLASSMNLKNLAFLQLGPTTTPYTTPDGAAVLLPSEEGIKTIVAALFSDHKLDAEAAVVEVQNGTSTQGLASRAVEYLHGLGIKEEALFAANAATPGHAKTEIVDFSGKTYTADKIASWLGLPKSAIRTSTAADAGIRTKPTSDIVVILGTDAKVDTNAIAP
jgi:LCP family protein required for cell wall assembly